MNWNTIVRRTVATLAATSLLFTTAFPIWAADLNAEMNNMFNSLGGVGNYTAPGAFKSQALNTYTGGNLFLRVPQKSYQLAQFSWPSAKGSCGGIDVYGGSFSHIAAAEFKEALKRIKSALPGIAFQMAIDAVSPLFGSTMKTMTNLMTMVNNARINSCETASALVNGAMDITRSSNESKCTRAAQEEGTAADTEEAKRMCTGGNLSSLLASFSASGNPSVKHLTPFTGNLTWDLLKRIPALDDLSRELIMNMTGTFIYHPPSENRDVDIIEPTITSVRDLLYGKSYSGININVEYWKCNDFTDCAAPTQRDIGVEPMTTKVERLLTAISDAIATRTPIPNNSAAISLVNHTTLPIYRILAVGNTIPNTGLPETLIGKYREVVAVDYTMEFMMLFLKGASAAMRQAGRLDSTQADDLKGLQTRVQAMKKDILAESAGSYEKLSSISTTIDEMERLERSLRTNMTTNVLDMLAYSSRRTQ